MSGTTTPTGGWLNRIATGSTAAWVDDDPEVGTVVDAVQMTPRQLLVIDELVRVNRLNLRAWMQGRDVARAVGGSAETAVALLMRLETARWVESRRVQGTHVREFRLTPAGAAMANDLRPANAPTPAEAQEALVMLREWLVDKMEEADEGGVTDRGSGVGNVYPSAVLALLDGYGGDHGARQRWYAEGQNLRYSRLSTADGRRFDAGTEGE